MDTSRARARHRRGAGIRLLSALLAGAIWAGCGGGDPVVVVRDPIDAESDILAWSIRVAQADGGPGAYMECGELAQLPGAWACMSRGRVGMNRAFLRASIFAEGLIGVEQGTVVSTLSSDYAELETRAAGHDLRSEDLLAFWSAAGAACRADMLSCGTREERALFERFIVPLASEHPTFVVIAVSADVHPDYYASHEVLHAQYFLQPAYAETVDAYWASDVGEADRSAIVTALGNTYASAPELVLRNEFQAYLLMTDAEVDKLSAFVPTHGPALTERLTARGVPPLRVR